MYQAIDLPAVTSVQSFDAQSTQPTGHGIGLRQAPAIWDYAVRKSGENADMRLSGYRAEKERFENALLRLPERERDGVRSLLEASRFVDYEHVAPAIVRAFRQRGRQSLLAAELHHHYNRNRNGADPEFRNMRAVNAYLKTTTAAPSVRRLLNVHTLAMADNVDQIASQDLGSVRSYAVHGDERDRGISELAATRVNKNIYLTFVDDESINRRAKTLKRRLGVICYPEPVTIKEVALARISETHPSVYRAVCVFRKLDLDQQCRLRDSNHTTYARLTQRLLRALLDERYAAFERSARLLGDLRTPQDVINFIKLTALHYRDIISIHPLGDGNGRSVRYESLYAPLDRVGISRPRLNNPNADVLYSPSEWVREVERGILSTDALYRDITERLTHGLVLETSPQLLFPNISRDVGIELRTRGRQRVQKNATLQPLDGAQFGAFVDVNMAIEPRLVSQLRRKPLSTMELMRERYKAFAKRTMALGHIPGRGTELVGLALVDLDYRSAFGAEFARDAERWHFKMGRWYHSELIWRGMCSTVSARTTEDILALFRQPADITLSNNSAGSAHLPRAKLHALIQREFDRYNADLIQGELYKKVIEHVGEGKGYATSYGLSTSRRWGIAAGFAWGKGFFGYVDSEIAAHQSELRERIVIGARQARKDVDVRRFKFLDSRFSYQFGRQQEILAIGAIDPDAVMVVQLLDHRRKVERSFVRDQMSPSTIWELCGGNEKVLEIHDFTSLPIVIRRHSL